MSQPSQNYCMKVERWILGGVPLEKMAMRPEQKFRAHLVTEVYHYWIDSPTIDPRKMLANFARRDYAFLLQQAAMGKEEAQEMVDAMHLTPESVRSANELSNDVYLLNYLVGRLSQSKKHIHRVMVESDIDWLRQYGRETGTWQAVNKAADKLMTIENNFRDDDDPQEQMPHTEINITGDISIIKADRESLSDEERDRLRKKYGLTDKEMAQQMEEINGIWQEPAEEEEKDIFVEMQEED